MYGQIGGVTTLHQIKRRPKPWCTQYSQDLKEHLGAEKQIAAGRADEVAIAAIRADPQILEEHLAIC